MKKFIVPKQSILDQLKGVLPKQLEHEMRKKTGKRIKVIDLGWDEEGIVVYYEGDKIS
jgi:hypothetical protein